MTKYEISNIKEKFLNGEVVFYDNYPVLGTVKCYSYNPEATAGGQIEVKYFDYDDITAGLLSGDIIDYLYTKSRTEITDKGEEGFEKFLSDIWKKFLSTNNQSPFVYIGNRNSSDVTFLTGCAYGRFSIYGIENPYLSFFYVDGKIKILDSNGNYINYFKCDYNRTALELAISSLKIALDNKNDYQTSIWLKDSFIFDIKDVANKKDFVGDIPANETNVIGDYLLFTKT
ncbi:MAG: hypothetical protein ACI4HM_10125 [Ruminococcus sp.]